MSDHVVAIVQARLGSSRLPKKVLADIAGRPMVYQVLRRAAAIPGVHTTIVAIPAGDRVLALELEHRGCAVYEGSEDDVLERYVMAARTAAADVIVRVTADCPLLDPAAAAGLIQQTLTDPRAFYTSWTAADGGVDGMDVEVCRRWILEAAHREATDATDREHVTTWIRKNCVNRFANPGFAMSLKCSVDTAEDLELVRSIYAQLKPGATSMVNTLAAALRAGVWDV